MMKERPILFSGQMVRAILDGRKKQTRRVVKNPEYMGCLTGDCPHDTRSECIAEITVFGATKCPYGIEMDRLWVRETFAAPWGRSGVFYRADDKKEYDGNWRPSIFMPRWASRITLEITEVRVERLQDISEEDAESEGTKYPAGGPTSCYRMGYSWLWESINGKGSWDENPWVWCITFKRIKP